VVDEPYLLGDVSCASHQQMQNRAWRQTVLSFGHHFKNMRVSGRGAWGDVGASHRQALGGISALGDKMK